MHVAHHALCALGSVGDVLPVIGIGERLRQDGHDVTLITTHNFADLAPALRTIAVGEPGAYAKAIQAMDARKPLKTLRIGRKNMLAKVAPIYAAIEKLQPDAITASSLVAGARIAHDRLGIPLTTVVSQTTLMRKASKAQNALFDLALMPRINAFRRFLSLKPLRWRDHPLLSRERVLLTWPEWFCPREAHYPAQAEHIGFVLRDLGPALTADDTPIVFTPGSWMTHAHDFFRAAAVACAELDMPGIFLTEHAAQIPKTLPRNVRHVPLASLRSLLPHARAVVHHGGPGTCAQGLAAGTPQLALPLMFDQFDCRDRLLALGVSVPFKQLTRGLAELLSSASVRERTQHYRSKCAS